MSDSFRFVFYLPATNALISRYAKLKTQMQIHRTASELTTDREWGISKQSFWPRLTPVRLLPEV
jgi:hypothetical protein